MKRIEISICIVLRSPFLFPSVEAPPHGLDAAALRDRSGRALIPQDQVRGVFRHAFARIVPVAEKLGEADFHTLFGRASGDAADLDVGAADALPVNTSSRARILFSDLTQAEVDLHAPPHKAVRVAIDPDTGAAKDGALVMVELAAPQGAEMVFKGKAVLFGSDLEATRWIAGLDAAATHLSALGAMKSAGFGEVVDCQVSEIERRDCLPKFDAAAAPKGRINFVIKIDRPFLVDARREADNVYSGARIVPGGAIKGALARKLELAGVDVQDLQDLSRLRIGHAMPAPANAPLPLSLAAVDGQIGDALRLMPGQAPMFGGMPAKFAPDWKRVSTKKANALFQIEDHDLPTQTRVHVAISGTSGTAETGKLFVENAVDPGDGAWHAVIDFSDVADPMRRAQFHAALCGGLDGVGRTGARLELTPSGDVGPTMVVPFRPNEDLYAVVLQSDAVMCSPDDAADPRDAYTDFWARVCPSAELVDFHASQRLAGGYLGLRFRTAGSGYAPFWLTETGSTFLLRGEISRELEGLCRSGLPAPRINGTTTDWRNCPFQPENGYGWIAANHRAALTEAFDV
jgi:hypothetical protein